MDTWPDHHHYHQTTPKIPGNSPDVLLGLVQRKGVRVFVASFSVEHLIFSRAHTIVGVTFTQKRKNEAGEETAKTSLINLVDLAGRWVIVSLRINSFGCLTDVDGTGGSDHPTFYTIYSQLPPVPWCFHPCSSFCCKTLYSTTNFACYFSPFSPPLPHNCHVSTSHSPISQSPAPSLSFPFSSLPLPTLFSSISHLLLFQFPTPSFPVSSTFLTVLTPLLFSPSLYPLLSRFWPLPSWSPPSPPHYQMYYK